MARRRDAKDPYTKDPRDPLELIAKFLVGSSYRVPAQGSGGVALRAADIAGAVAYMKDPLEKRAVLAVATRAGSREVAQLSLMAYRRVIRCVRDLRPQPIDLHQPADRWRLRIAVYDAATELVWPERRRSLKDLAKAANMRVGTYAALHRCATSSLQEALNDGRRHFRAGLWND